MTQQKYYKLITNIVGSFTHEIFYKDICPFFELLI